VVAIVIAVILFAVAIGGLAGAVVLLQRLAKPFFGWKSTYDASAEETTLHIPEAGRYSINIQRDKYWLSNGQGNASEVLQHVGFSIKKYNSEERLRYFPSKSMSATRIVDRMTVQAGFFNVVEPDWYSITTMPRTRYLQNHEIVLRQEMLPVLQAQLIAGLVVCSCVFLLGLIFGVITILGAVQLLS